MIFPPAASITRVCLTALTSLLLAASASRAGVVTAWDFSTAVSGSGSTITGDANDVGPTSINFQTGATGLTRGAGFTANPLQAFQGLGAVNGHETTLMTLFQVQSSVHGR